MNHRMKYITAHMTAVRLQGRIALHHTRWHTKWKLFFEVSHTIKMTHCYAAHLGFSLLFLKKTTNHKLKTEVTWPEKRLSQWSQQTAMSACESLRPPFGTRLIKTTSILLLNQLMDFIKSPHQPNLTKTCSVCAFTTPRREKGTKTSASSSHCTKHFIRSIKK